MLNLSVCNLALENMVGMHEATRRLKCVVYMYYSNSPESEVDRVVDLNDGINFVG